MCSVTACLFWKWGSRNVGIEIGAIGRDRYISDYIRKVETDRSSIDIYFDRAERGKIVKLPFARRRLNNKLFLFSRVRTIIRRKEQTDLAFAEHVVHCNHMFCIYSYIDSFFRRCKPSNQGRHNKCCYSMCC
jgi:succinylglutamate desuccinylase